MTADICATDTNTALTKKGWERRRLSFSRGMSLALDDSQLAFDYLGKVSGRNEQNHGHFTYRKQLHEILNPLLRAEKTSKVWLQIQMQQGTYCRLGPPPFTTSPGHCQPLGSGGEAPKARSLSRSSFPDPCWFW